jgi:metal-responsive CopG/Arc/MetJ family transcriptional regulator
MQRISITLDDKLKTELDQTIPKGERAAFVAKAIANQLATRGKQQAVDMLKSFPRFRVNKSSVEVVRQIREERAEYLAGQHTNNTP